LQGSVLTNKYADGLPGRRYYGWCEHVDAIENIARDRAKSLFGAEFANVQPHSGAQANAAVLASLMSPGERLLGLDLANGGHLTHGMKLNFSGKVYESGCYGVDPVTGRIDMDAVRATAIQFRPRVLIAGWSAYPRTLDFAAFRSIADEVGAHLWVDMAHFAGLIAAGLHPSPVPHADLVSTTVHKTLGGARSGLILGKQRFAKAVNSSVFPGTQGGPAMQVVAAKAVTFKIATTHEFADRQRRTLSGARIIADRLLGTERRAGGRPRRDRWHRRPPCARRPPRFATGRQGRRGPAAGHRHHGQPQRGAQRSAAPDGHVGPANRLLRSGHPRVR
jgi:glycine hydroxymethyltransferase